MGIYKKTFRVSDHILFGFCARVVAIDDHVTCGRNRFLKRHKAKFVQMIGIRLVVRRPFDYGATAIFLKLHRNSIENIPNGQKVDPIKKRPAF